MVWLDGLAMSGISPTLTNSCLTKLSSLAGKGETISQQEELLRDLGDRIQVGPYSLLKREESSEAPKASSYSFRAATTSSNVRKLLRCLEIRKPILLEGSPGIGKTSLVEALAAAVHQPLTHINLSDQTDINDLFGTDLPLEGGGSGEFHWVSGGFPAGRAATALGSLG